MKVWEWARAITAVLGCVGLMTQPVCAGQFVITPTTVTLKDTPASDIQVSNIGGTPVRLSVNGFGWSQTPADGNVKTSSKAIVYFPYEFVLPPMGIAHIRVGVSGAAGAIERSYRLVITELPSQAHITLGPSSLTMVGQMDLPVFVSPVGDAQPKPELGDVSVGHGIASVTLRNTGNVHVRQSWMHFVAYGSNGAMLWQQTLTPFYVLAGSQQLVTTPIPPAVCRRSVKVVAQWTLRDGLGEQQSATQTVSCR